MPKPIPVPDATSKPFWDALKEKRLIVQNCSACNRRQYPPQETCAQCGKADNLGWLQTSGRGKINGYSVMYDSRVGPLQADQPFNIAVIELEDDPAIKFLSHLPGVPVEQVPVGASVVVDFQDVGEGMFVHEWRVV